MNGVLWLCQVVLAGLFLLAGGVKLVLPANQLTGPVTLPIWFLRFIGLMEILGALGLILPMALKIRPVLTPMAASGLVVVMVGATLVTVLGGQIGLASIPLGAGVLTGFVAWGRRASGVE